MLLKESWILYALGSVVFAGLTVFLAKIGLEKIPSNIATLLRTAVILFFLGALLCFRQESLDPAQLTRRHLLFTLLSGLVTGLSWMCYYRALQIGPVSLVSSIDKLSLVIVVTLSVLFLGEKLSGLQWLGAAFVVLGTFLIAIFSK